MIALTGKRSAICVCGTRIPAKAFDMIDDVPVIYRKRHHFDEAIVQAVKEIGALTISEGDKRR